MSLARIVKASLLFLAPAVALAHPGHDHANLAQGVLHPITGIDHILAMLAVGIWGAQQGDRMRFVAPLSFVAMMSMGTLLAAVGVTIPQMELGITASVMALGVAIAFAVRLQPLLGAAIIGTFAVFHGYAHGVEVKHVSVPFVLGMLATTVALHAIGIGLALVLKKQLDHRTLRWVGAPIALGGLALALGA